MELLCFTDQAYFYLFVVLAASSEPLLFLLALGGDQNFCALER